jgi:hypothetical protein
MDETIIPIMYNAVMRGDTSSALRLVGEHPELRNWPDPGGCWLADAASHGQLAMVQALVEIGFNVNNGNPIDRPLERAVHRSDLDLKQAKGDCVQGRFLAAA